ncbi:ABC transporter ATP-binding protein [Sanguibacter sp. Z1732]|uniref:ABC transporter ATP-binding protein n=1 Tax=Sanguibacter sp. Z1732 TaxID=3435412 RepID=UPI003D9CBC10
MIRFESVSLVYPGSTAPVLRDVHLAIPEGELCLVTGATGAGKSSLLGAACARVPHFTGGVLTGRVLVDGRDTETHLPRDLADLVGVVTQDPLLGFVTDTVEEELAFALEQLGLPRPVMRKRVEEVLDLLALAPLRDRALTELSGGEQQRVAIGAVMTAQPRILVLDEPTSALDPGAAEDVLAALTRLVHDLGVTVLLAEHRLERVIQFADSVLEVHPDGTVTYGDPGTVLAAITVRLRWWSWAASRGGTRCRCRCGTRAGVPGRCAHGWGRRTVTARGNPAAPARPGRGGRQGPPTTTQADREPAVHPGMGC